MPSKVVHVHTVRERIRTRTRRSWRAYRRALLLGAASGFVASAIVILCLGQEAASGAVAGALTAYAVIVGGTS